MSDYGQYGDSRGGLTEAVFLLGAEASFGFFVIASAAFTLAHWRNWLPTVYACRKFLFPDRCVSQETPPHRRNVLSWLLDSFPTSDKDILNLYGLDALLFLRSLRMQSLVIFLSAVYGIGILLPVHLHGRAAVDTDSWGVNMTTSHLGPLSDVDLQEAYDYNYTRLFIAHIIGGYFITIVTLFILWRQYGEVVELRHAFKTRPEPENYTILVHHIPTSMRSNAAVAAHFEHLFPNSVKKVTIMLELPELESLIAKRTRVANRLEWACVVQADHSQLRCRCCRSPASITHLVEELSEELPRLEAQVQEMQEDLIDWHVRHEFGARQVSQAAKMDVQALTQTLCLVQEESETADDDVSSISQQHPASVMNGEGHNADREDRRGLGKGLLEEGRGPGEGRRLSWTLDRVGREQSRGRVGRLRDFRERTRKTFRFFLGNPVGAVAFVSFRSLAVSSIAGRCVTYHHSLKMLSQPAPQPEDILWDNVYMPMRQVPFKSVLGISCSIIITLFFSVIVGVIASFTSVKTLNDHVPFIRKFLEHSKLAQSLLPYLPAFLLVLVDSAIPSILSLFCRTIFREVRTVSEAHTLVFRRLYFFLLWNNFFVLFLSSSLNTYFAIAEDPHTTLVELGTFLPNISSFYIGYIMIKVLVSHPMELIRFSSYIMAALRWMFTDDLTGAQKATRVLGMNALERPGGFNYGRVYADNLFVFTITMTFSLVAPLILPFALAFFAGALTVYKRQILFVYEPEFESAGIFWPRTYRRMVAALYFMQAALLCILITNEAFQEIGYMLPMPILTFLASLIIVKSFRNASEQLPLGVAKEVDDINRQWGESYSFLNNCYVQPALRSTRERRQSSVKHPAGYVVLPSKESDGEFRKERKDEEAGGKSNLPGSKTTAIPTNEQAAVVQQRATVSSAGIGEAFHNKAEQKETLDSPEVNVDEAGFSSPRSSVDE